MSAYLRGLLAGAVCCGLLPGCSSSTVDSPRLLAADQNAAQWMMDGRSYEAQRYSPLEQINENTVHGLGLAWFAELDTFRGVEATPLAVDGVLYNTSAWNITSAYDAKTGRPLWTYDPQVPRAWGRYACCEPVSRGLAMWKRNILITTLDGRLIALSAKTGAVVWSVQTFDKDWPYTITGTPRVFDGKVVVGNSGADFGVRGFVAAYDADTGKALWKFFLVPGDPAKGPDGAASDPIMAMAAKTWTGSWWKMGGGGTAWDSFTYDPKRKLVYVGTGNGSPIAQQFRSPGGGDNLFLCSVVALDAETGAYRLWEMPVQSAPVAGPITFAMDGEQYIAVNAGWGGGAAQVERMLNTNVNRASARLLVFKLGGKVQLPPLSAAQAIPDPPPLRADEDTVRRGADLFANTCAQCHGQLAVGGVKDLRHMTPESHASFNDIVLKGLRVDKGMASFASLLGPADAEAIHAYVISRANEDWGRKEATK
ncbi:MAG: PQQ-binding-like beta-propeller repeat protein [Gammaproteobacteria bacterium]